MPIKAKQLWTDKKSLVQSLILLVCYFLFNIICFSAVFATETSVSLSKNFFSDIPETDNLSRFAPTTVFPQYSSEASLGRYRVCSEKSNRLEYNESETIRSQVSLFRSDQLTGLFRVPMKVFDRIDFGEHLGCSWKRTRTRTWVRGYGTWSDLGSSNYFGSLEVKSFGIAVGLDQQIGRNLLWGMALGGNRSRFKQKYSESKENLSAFFGTAFARTTFQRIFLDIEGGFGRNESLSWNDLSISNDWKNQWHFKGEMGTWWSQGLGKVEPYVGIRYVHLDMDSSSDLSTLQAGVRYSWKSIGAFSVLVPRIYAGVLRELGDQDLFTAAPFTDSPTVYWIPNYDIPKTRMFFGGGFTSSMGTSLDLYLRYTAEVTSGYASHVLWFGTNWCF